MIDHFLDYYKASQKEMAYKIYMSDLLWGFVEGEKRNVPRYYDIINDTPVAEETRTPEEIIEQVRKKIRGQV